MPPIRTILCPTDFSGSSLPAFDYACDLARDYGARLIAVHVVEPIPPIVADGIVFPAETEYVRSTAREQLAQLKAADRRVAFDQQLREGPAADEITRSADEAQADLIVMGTHGRTGLHRLLLGSVAEQVLRHARCPVLFVKAGASDATARRQAADAIAGI